MIQRAFKTVVPVLALAVMVVLLGGCNGNATTAKSDATGSVTLHLTAGGVTAAGAALRPAAALSGGVSITAAQASFREIEFVMEGEAPEMAMQEPEFEGTFYVDLFAARITGQLLGQGTIPAGTYDAIEFKLDSTANPPQGFANLANRSLYIAGTAGVSSTPFSLGVSAGGGDAQIVVTGPHGFTVAPGATADLVVDFNLAGVLAFVDAGSGKTVATLITEAVARVGGNPAALDSSNAPEVVAALLAALHAEVDAGEDRNHDGHLDDTEDLK